MLMTVLKLLLFSAGGKFCCESRTIQVLSKNVFHSVFFKFIRILKWKHLYLTCMRKMIIFNNPFLIYVFVSIFWKNNINSNFIYKDKSSVCFLSVVLSVVLCLYRYLFKQKIILFVCVCKIPILLDTNHTTSLYLYYI